jgi:hypothetical protein
LPGSSSGRFHGPHRRLAVPDCPAPPRAAFTARIVAWQSENPFVKTNYARTRKADTKAL